MAGFDDYQDFDYYDDDDPDDWDFGSEQKQAVVQTRDPIKSSAPSTKSQNPNQQMARSGFGKPSVRSTAPRPCTTHPHFKPFVMGKVTVVPGENSKVPTASPKYSPEAVPVNAVSSEENWDIEEDIDKYLDTEAQGSKTDTRTQMPSVKKEIKQDLFSLKSAETNAASDTVQTDNRDSYPSTASSSSSCIKNSDMAIANPKQPLLQRDSDHGAMAPALDESANTGIDNASAFFKKLKSGQISSMREREETFLGSPEVRKLCDLDGKFERQFETIFCLCD